MSERAGKWTHHRNGCRTTLSGHSVVADESGTPICYVTSGEENLIAAAPQIYEALERCLIELETHAEGHSDAEIEIARAALAAARGESQ